MGDPGLGPEDAVDVAIPHRAGLQAGEVRAGIRLGKNTAVGSTARRTTIPGSQPAFCSGVPLRRISSPAISERVPSEPTPI